MSILLLYQVVLEPIHFIRKFAGIVAIASPRRKMLLGRNSVFGSAWVLLYRSPDPSFLYTPRIAIPTYGSSSLL